jgi:glucose-1-phosphate cytidylyltransferase
MKAIILAGGLGSRISEETYLRPKPMVTIGGRPIIWHIMQKFTKHGITDFIICLGYKSEVIKDYFLNFNYYNSNVRISTIKNHVEVLNQGSENWSVTLVETGANSNTAERLKRVKDYIVDDNFCFTYGDGLSDQNLTDTISFHTQMNKTVTLTAVNPPARYGAVEIKSGLVKKFSEKTTSPDSLINGGYFVVSSKIFEVLEPLINPSWEFDVLPNLAAQGQLSAFEHNGFWFAMDTLRDKEYLEQMLEIGDAPWLK